MKILIVEDDFILHKSLCAGLKKLGYLTDSAFDGEEALELFELNSYDAIVLDLNLPKLDGIDVLKCIRKVNSELNVLILSARVDVEDKILGLDLGANDYLAKPFHFNELDARLRALLRRKFAQLDNILTHGALKLDLAQKKVFIRESPIELTKKEFGILEYLFLNKDRVISAEEIIEHVWDSEVDLFSNSFKVHINSLKKKLSSMSNGFEFIKNTRGIGYYFAEVNHEIS